VGWGRGMVNYENPC